MEIVDIVKIVVSCITFAFGVISFVIALVKAVKSKNVIKVQELLQSIPDYINESEKLFNFANDKLGINKKLYVMEKLRTQKLVNHIKITDEELSDNVEKVLSTPQKKRDI